MNATNPKRPEPHEDDRVTDVTIPADELKRLYEERRREKAREARRAKVKRLLTAGTVAGLLVVCGAEAVAIAVMLPLKEFVPVVTYQRDDGTFTNYAQWEDLPREVREDTTVNVVWNYVQLRESWSEGNASWAWTVVSAMSSPSVRESFQKWYSKDNPDSPVRVYGESTVDVRYVNWAPVCTLNDDACPKAPPAYRIWFDRVETPRGGQPKPPVRYAVTTRILRNVPIPKDRLWQRWTFNAPQIQVIEYPGAQREGVSR
jgi:hypothetical protein